MDETKCMLQMRQKMGHIKPNSAIANSLATYLTVNCNFIVNIVKNPKTDYAFYHDNYPTASNSDNFAMELIDLLV